MTKVFVAAGFAAVALAAMPASACDWSREASARDPVVATTAMPAEPQAAANPTQPANLAADPSARRPASEPTAPVVLVTDQHRE
ncbi:MAG TPA: hypothetical protein VMM15_30795 [Bradyrhizobium sp.]|nr:hypothetical protein [Bradyrhizobium sp.]